MKTLIAVLFLALVCAPAFAQLPSGVFPVGPNNTENAYLISQSTVKGQVILPLWAMLNPSAGVYDWSTIESAIAPWWMAGKKTGIVIWNPAPAWVLALMTGTTTVTCGAPITVPNFLDPAYQSAYSTFLAAFFAHYGNDARVAYIRLGIGGDGETFPTCKPQQEATFGLTQPKWLTYAESMISGVTPGSVPTMISLSCYGDPCNTTTRQLAINLAAFAVGKGFGIGNASLQNSDQVAFNAGQLCGADWCAMFTQYASSFHDLQFAEPTCADGNCTVGSPIALLPFAAARGADVVEMAEPDMAIAFGPSPGAYTTAYQAAIAAFDNATGLPAAPTNFQVTVSPGPSSANVTPGSLNFSFTAADTVNGNAALITGHEILLVRNTDSTAHNFTIYSTPDPLGRLADVGPYSIAAGQVTSFSFLGAAIFGTGGWQQPDGSMHVQADDTHVQFALLKCQL